MYILRTYLYLNVYYKTRKNKNKWITIHLYIILIYLTITMVSHNDSMHVIFIKRTTNYAFGKIKNINKIINSRNDIIILLEGVLSNYIHRGPFTKLQSMDEFYLSRMKCIFKIK